MLVLHACLSFNKGDYCLIRNNLNTTKERKYSIYMDLIKPFSLIRNLHLLSTDTKRKTVSLAHVPKHYFSCIRQPLKKKKAQGHTRIAQSTKTKGFYQPPLPKMSLLVGGSLQADSACREMFWCSTQGQKHDHSSHVWQEVIDPKAVLFLHQ